MKYTVHEANILINSFPEGTVGERLEADAIYELDKLGVAIGWGRLAQIACELQRLQVYNDKEELVRQKRWRFESMNYDLPKDFSEVAGL